MQQKIKNIEVSIKNKTIFQPEILDLLKVLFSVGFFDESQLIGSWVMPVYKEAFGIHYVLRTMDIDFAVKFALKDKEQKVDIEKIITELGYIPVVMHSGIRSFTRENFTLEFFIHRKGSSNDQIFLIKKWNITAIPLPFMDILLNFPFTADFGSFKIKVPLPEAFFVHKMISAQRRINENKKDKDLEQCAIIAPDLEHSRLHTVLSSLKFSKKTQKALKISCDEIKFPPQMLGLQ